MGPKRQVAGYMMALVCAMAALSGAGCKGESCYAPPPLEQVREGVWADVGEALDAMDASPGQRALMREQVEAMVAASVTLRGVREPQKHALLDELRKPKPSREVVVKLSKRMSADAVVLYHEAVTRVEKTWPKFTLKQRAALAAHLDSPFKPLKDSWVAAQFLEYQLSVFEATPAQRETVHALKKDYFSKINALRLQAHRDKQQVLAQLASQAPDLRRAHRLVDAGARRYDRLVMQGIDDGEALLATMTPAQRDKLNVQLDRARTCPSAP